MRASNHWSEKEYVLLDASQGERLERWGDVTLIRPDPQVIWNTEKGPAWEKAAAHYIRSSSGGGHWESKHLYKDEWTVRYQDLVFRISPTNFKHTGLFPEQATNWDWFQEKIQKANRPLKVLNLFAYTGGATLACAKAGATVCHVDASKGMVAWAKENQRLSGMTEKPIRWIVDDCRKFVEREIRRGSYYDGIIMDPPSYGRGPNGEIWKLEENIDSLIQTCIGALSDNPLFFVVNSYTTGLSPSVMNYILGVNLVKKFGGKTNCDEIGLTVKESGYVLPCGATAIWEREE